MAGARGFPYRRIADILILLSAISITVMGILTLTAGRVSPAYASAQECRALGESPYAAMSTTCYSRVWMIEDSAARTRKGKLGPETPTMTLTWPGASPETFTVTVLQPPASFSTLIKTPRSPVSVKVWNGVPTAIYYPVDSNSGMRTTFNPYSTDDLRQWGGIALVGVGLVIFVVHPALWLLPVGLRAAAGRRFGQWQTTSRSTAEIFSYIPLRVALVGLIALSFLDIATSIRGARCGLYEANPVAVEMIGRWGQLGAFFALKLPALIAVILATTKLPRRIAVVVALAGCAVMVYIVGQNVYLLLNVSANACNQVSG